MTGDSNGLPIETAPLDKNILLWWRPIAPNPYAETWVIGQISSHQPGAWWNGQTGRHQDIRHIACWLPLPARPKLENLT